jgi:hypothetical protein
MENKKITLDWKSLSKLDTLNDSLKKRGVYIWGFEINNKFIPYYVGIAENIYQRIIEHLSSIIDGRYTIYHQNSLEEFYNYQNLEVNSDWNSGKLYKPDWPGSFINFIKDKHKLQPHVDFMIDTLTFSYAESDNELKELEKSIINKIGKERLANTRSGKSDNLDLTHTGEKNICELFEFKD